jgi:hypothetical protein
MIEKQVQKPGVRRENTILLFPPYRGVYVKQKSKPLEIERICDNSQCLFD